MNVNISYIFKILRWFLNDCFNVNFSECQFQEYTYGKAAKKVAKDARSQTMKNWRNVCEGSEFRKNHFEFSRLTWSSSKLRSVQIIGELQTTLPEHRPDLIRLHCLVARSATNLARAALQIQLTHRPKIYCRYSVRKKRSSGLKMRVR